MKVIRPYQKQAIKECWDALKKDDQPVLLMASVGSGKSLMISEILLRLEHENKRALCLVNNSELVRNNASTFALQGGNPSIYSSSLNSKCNANNVVFATPQTVLNAINKNKKIAQIKFNLIVVDEAHTINYENYRSTFMRILRHYKTEYPKMRVLGCTGTNFRFKGKPIVGEGCLFKTQVGNITTSWLIEQDYLVKPKFEIDRKLLIDFSKVKTNSMGQFDQKQMQSVIDKNDRLTGQILNHLKIIMGSQNRFGCFIFACTRAHCDECARSLPPQQTAIITAKTSEVERQIILDKARMGTIKYLINVQVLTVGIDIPGYDTLLFLRPTESLVLAVQMIGRVLRQYPNKREALIIDCAGNLDRHSDWDDPIISNSLEELAINDPDKDINYPFECPDCSTMNSEHARRCRGVINKKRCDYYFSFKDCPSCERKNDLTARNCRWCEYELLDPNRHLNIRALNPGEILAQVDKWNFIDMQHSFGIQYICTFDNQIMPVMEQYYPTKSPQAKNLFYAKFVKEHCATPSAFYPNLINNRCWKNISDCAKKPDYFILNWSGSKWDIKKKIFNVDNS